MKSKCMHVLLAGVLGLAAWSMHRPGPAHADKVPVKYRETINKGLAYLVKNQRPDGHWEGDDGQYPVALTAMAGLALLMEQEVSVDFDVMEPGTFSKAKYPANIHKAAEWLLAKSKARRDGLIFSDHASETDRYMEGHGLATLLLAGIYRDRRQFERQTAVGEALVRAVGCIVKAQSSRGGWHRTSRVEGHDFDEILTTVVQLQALEAAQNAGIGFASAEIRDAHEYLKTMMDKYDAGENPEPNRSRSANTAAALSCYLPAGHREGIQAAKTQELHRKRLKYCQSAIPAGRDLAFGRDELVHYYYAQAQFRLGGWPVYSEATFEQLRLKQNKDGSWPAGEGFGVGPVYSTAVWCTILQLERHSHPFRPPEARAIF